MKTDVVIVGSGPAGSACALHLLRAGIRPVLIEREAFPRYHIGESLTTACGAMLRQLGLERRMNELGFPVKRGVKVHGPDDRTSFYVPVQQRDASGVLRPTDTWQVRRSVFDQMLLETARQRGAELLQATSCEPLVESGRVRGVRVTAGDGATRDLRAEVLVDASGQRTFLAKHGLTGAVQRGKFDKQVALFSQVAGADRDPLISPGDTALFLRERHHWGWFIPLADDIVSVGVVANRSRFRARPTADAGYLQRALCGVNPALAARLRSAELTEEVRAVSSYSYRIERFTGPGFLCVGDSHRFTDPIFSFGVSFAFHEAELAAQAIHRCLAGSDSDSDSEAPFAGYERVVDQAQDIIADMMTCFWDHPLAFLAFVHRRYKDDVIDTFAGRIYGAEAQERPLTHALRRMLALPATAQDPPARAV